MASQDIVDMIHESGMKKKDLKGPRCSKDGCTRPAFVLKYRTDGGPRDLCEKHFINESEKRHGIKHN